MASLLTIASDMVSWFKRRDNPHEVTAQQVGTYSKEEIESKLPTTLIAPDALAMTRFGNMLWMPLTFSATLEGSTRNESERHCVMMANDDGLPTLLMNATNGIREAVYYSTFSLDGNAKIVGHNPIGSEYRPKFIGTAEWITAIHQSSARTAIWGKVAGNPTYKNWVCLTNGTLNPEAHVGAYFNAPDGVGEDALVIVSGQYVYLIQPLSNNLRMNVYSCPVVDIQTKSAVEWRKRSGIDTQSVSSFKGYLLNEIVFGNYLLGSTKRGSVFIVSDSELLASLTITDRMLWGDVDPSTQVMTFRFILTGFRLLNNVRIPLALGITFTFSLTDTGLVATVSPGIDGNTYITPDGSKDIGFKLVGPNAYLNEQVVITDKPNYYSTACIGDDGVGFAVSFPPNSVGMISAFVSSETTKPWDFWDYTKQSTTLTGWRGLVRKYPGVFGDHARCTHVLSGNSMGVFTESNGQTFDSTQTTFAELIDYDTTGIVTYPTQRLGDLIGFKYSAVENQTLLPRLKVGHCEYYSHETKSFSIGMGRLMDGKLSNFTEVSSTLEYTGSVSVTENQWSDFKAKVQEEIPTVPWGDATDVRMELQVFKDPAIPCVGFLCAYVPSTSMYYSAAFVLNTSNRTGELTNITFARTLIVSSSPGSTGLSERGLGDYVPACVFSNPAGGYNVISIVQAIGSVSASSSPALALVLLLNTGESDYRSDWLQSGWDDTWYFGHYHVGVIPGAGIGKYNTVANRALCGTGLVWQQFPNDYGSIEAFDLTDSLNLLIASQQPPAGWVAYVGENIPVLLHGKHQILAATAIDLTLVKGNPADTTFYVYVEDDGTKLGYVVYDTEQPETLARCSVGSIVTNNSGIESSTLRRVTRIGTHAVGST